MPARQKLNAASLNGAAAVAAVVGALAESWTAFLVAMGILVATSVLGGEIRPGRRR